MRKIDRRDSYLIDIHMRNQNSGEPPTPKLTPIRSKNSFNDEIEKEDNENK